MRRAPEKQADLLALREAELRAARRLADPGAGLLADWLNEERGRLERSIENGRRSEHVALPLFDGSE